MSLADQFQTVFEPRFRLFANRAQKILISEAPSNTGALHDAIKVERVSWFRYRVGVDSSQLASDPRNPSGRDYSEFIISGHSGFTIRPVKAKALRWVGKDGKVHFAAYVHMPPRKPNNFVARARARLPRL